MQLEGIYAAYDVQASAACGKYGADVLSRLSVLNVTTGHRTTGPTGDAACNPSDSIVLAPTGVAAQAVCGPEGWTLLITDPTGSTAIAGPAGYSRADPFAPYAIYDCSAASAGCPPGGAIVSWTSGGQTQYRPAP